MDRHLTPAELDLLLDGDIGFAAPVLERHVHECAPCRAELGALRAVIASLGKLPHLAPPPFFTDQVMAQVAVFQPWYVTLEDTARGLVPQTRPVRIMAGTLAGLAAATVSTVAVTVATNWAMSKLIIGLVADHVERSLEALFTSSAVSVLGDPAVTAVQAHGRLGLAATTSAAVVVVGLGAMGLRVAAGASRTAESRAIVRAR